jgi:hypothetical protein
VNDPQDNSEANAEHTTVGIQQQEAIPNLNHHYKIPQLLPSCAKSQNGKLNKMDCNNPEETTLLYI